ncbi:MAG: hypothetical protein AB1611_03605 [bacterium]
MSKAVDLDSKTINVTATVLEYAEITGDLSAMELAFSGAANESLSDTNIIHVETNCAATVSVTATPLTHMNGGTITTEVTIDGTSSIDVDVQHNGDHSVTITGTTGAISAQEAGEYGSVITITVAG